MTNSTTTHDISLDSTSSRFRGRRRSLAVLMTGALAATIGLGAVAPAADAAVSPVVGAVSVSKIGPVAPGPSLSLSSTPGSGVITASGSGFAVARRSASMFSTRRRVT